MDSPTQQGFLDNPTMHGTATIKENKEEEKPMSTQKTEDNGTSLMRYTPIVPSTELGNFGIEGLEDLDRTDLVLPRKSILQPTSKKDGETGCFYDNLTQQAVPELECVILKIGHDGTLWSGDPSAERPECTSMDGIRGSRYGLCSQCQFNPKVHPELWEKGQKRCSPGYLILAADRGNEDGMFILSADKTSARPIKPIITRFKTKGRPPFHFLTRFNTSQEKNDMGRYYVLKPSIICQLAPDEIQRYHEMYLSMRDAKIHDVDEDVEDKTHGAPPDFDENGEPIENEPF